MKKNIKLYTYSEIINQLNLEIKSDMLFYVQNGLERYKEETGESGIIVRSLLNTSILPIWSDPTIADSDCDFIDDTNDLRPLNTTLSGKMTSVPNSLYLFNTDVSFTVNYLDFIVTNNEKYNKDLSVLGSVMSTLMYTGSSLDLTDDVKNNGDINNIKKLYDLWGFTNEEVDIAELMADGKINADDDISAMRIGHKKITFGKKTYELIFVTVRGTDDSIEEWSSNFDVGYYGSEYTDINNTKEWENYDNHKGFDVTANRLYKKITEYVANNVDNNAEKIIYITGHSRGAAIANILGTKFSDSTDYTSFTYCYATPNTTTSENYNKYKSIFNIVNDDDLVPKLPLYTWDFRKYGQTYSASIHNSYERHGFDPLGKSWESMFGEDYNDNGYLIDTISKFGKIAYSRKDLYTYSNDKATVYTYKNVSCSSSKTIQEIEKEYIDRYGERIAKYCQISVKPSKKTSKNSDDVYYDVEVKQTPAFLIMVLTDIASSREHKGSDNDTSKVTAATRAYYRRGNEDSVIIAIKKVPRLGFYVAPKYKNAKDSFCRSCADVDTDGKKFNIGGMVHAHMPATYYLLAADSRNELKKW